MREETQYLSFTFLSYFLPPFHIHPKPSLWRHFPEVNSLVESVSRCDLTQGSMCMHTYAYTCEYNPWVHLSLLISHFPGLTTGVLGSLYGSSSWKKLVLSLSSHWPPEALHIVVGPCTFAFNEYQEWTMEGCPWFGERLHLIDSVRVYSESWRSF